MRTVSSESRQGHLKPPPSSAPCRREVSPVIELVKVRVAAVDLHV